MGNSYSVGDSHNYEINTKLEKLNRFKNPTKVDDKEIFSFLSSHSESQARVKFQVGLSRISRIQRQLGQKIKRRRKTNK